MLGFNKPLIAVMVITSTSSFATPTIETMSGDLSAYSTITIEGSNFGNKPNASPSFWNTLDSKNSLADLPDSSVVPSGSSYAWGDNGSAWSKDIKIDKLTKLNGSPATYAGNSKGFLKWPNKLNTSNQEQIFVSWWFKIDGSPSNGGSNKFIRIWDDSNGDGTRISWTSMHLTYNDSSGGSPNWGDWGGNVGSWNKMEIWVSSTKNEIKTWVNGKETHSANDFVKPNSLPLNIYEIGFDPSDASKYPDIKFNFNEVYISETQARVEISDKPTWNDPESIKHIQVATNWSDNKIEVNLNESTSSLKGSAFLYVIDENGNVNQQGFPVCGNCPQSPILSIE